LLLEAVVAVVMGAQVEVQVDCLLDMRELLAVAVRQDQVVELAELLVLTLFLILQLLAHTLVVLLQLAVVVEWAVMALFLQ
jgi:hypothetical protein